MPRVNEPAVVNVIPWRLRSDASVARKPILAGRTVEAVPGCGPRNPVMGVLSRLGQLLSRTFAAMRPGAARTTSPVQSAAEQTRARLSRVLEQAVSGKATAATLATDLRKLADSHRRWAQLDPQTADDPQRAEREFDQMVEEALDERWPGAQGLELVHALAAPVIGEAQQALQDGHDLEAQGLLMRLAESVTRTVGERAFDTIDHGFRTALDTIRSGELSSLITTQVEAAVATGAVILDQLRQDGALESVALGNVRAEHRTRLEDEQTADILHASIEKSGASPHQIEVLLQHLSPQSLLTLRRDFGDETALDSAIEQEIKNRPTRLVEQLALGSSSSTRDRSSTIVSYTMGNEMERVDDVTQQILDHCAFFGVAVPQQLREELSGFERSLSTLAIDSRTLRSDQIVKARAMADRMLDPAMVTQLQDSWMQHVASLDQAATQRTHILLDQLIAGSPAAQLAACKDLVTAIRAMMRANGVEEGAINDHTTRERLHAELGRLLTPLLRDEAVKRQAPQLLAALRSPQMQIVTKALSVATSEAEKQNLPALQADLKDACIVLQMLTYELEDLAPDVPEHSASTSSAATLKPETQDQLAKLYSTLQQPDGRITITQGHFASQVETLLVENIQQPFSEKELVSRQVGELQVPAEFLKDAERNTQYFMANGQPLIDRKGWESLTMPQKEERIADGYRRLVRFYQNNLQQTEAIVRLAHQGLVAGFGTATQQASAHSPLVLEGYGAGYLTVGGGGASLTSVHFSTGENHRPRLELSYEVQGGRLHLLADDGTPTGDIVYLDRKRSLTKVSVVVETHADRDRLSVVGKPVYDVHLVKSPIQRDYRLPEVEHLLNSSRSDVLYRDLIEFAKRQVPEAANELQAMQLIVKAQHEQEQGHAFGHVKILCDRHLRSGAAQPLKADANLLVPVLESVQAADEQTLHIFDAAMADIRRHVPEFVPDWQPDGGRGIPSQVLARLREQGGEAGRMADFVESVKVFTLDRNRTLEDAQLIVGRFLDEPAAGESPIGLRPEVMADTRAGVRRAVELREHCTRLALEPLLQTLTATAAQVLPAFTAELRAEAEQMQGAVNVDAVG
jgi:hypothetical protein